MEIKPDKKEQLKEVLNQTISAEDIQKRLKAEIDESKKKKKENPEENSSEEIHIEKVKNKKIKNPSMHYQNQEEGFADKKVLYFFILFSIVLLAIIIYLLKFQEPRIEVKEKIITKEIVKEIEVPKEIIKEVEVIKEVSKAQKFDTATFKEYFNAMKSTSLKCYDFSAGRTQPTQQCRKKIEKFLTTNKDALRFEVIPVIGKGDNKIYDNLKAKIDLTKLDKALNKKVEKYMFRGLARDRVIETTWYIKDVLKKPGVITTTNYYATSKQENRGIIIKAYH